MKLGTRHIIDAMREAGYDITTLFLCGGLSKNSLFVQTHANTTGQCSLTHIHTIISLKISTEQFMTTCNKINTYYTWFLSSHKCESCNLMGIFYEVTHTHLFRSQEMFMMI